MPLPILPFLAAVARIAGPLVARTIAKRLGFKEAVKAVPKGLAKKGFPKQPKVETIREATIRRNLARGRLETKQAIKRQFRQQAEQDKASRELVARVARENKQLEEVARNALGDLVKGLRKDQLKNSIITGRGGTTSKAVRDFNKAATRELLKIVKPKPPKGPRGPRGT